MKSLKLKRWDLSSFQVEYLFLDAIYESIRKQYGVKEGILCAWGICRGGEKVLLSVGLGNQESYEDWLEFLRDMVKRGLPVPTFVTSDGAPGLIKAIEAVFPKSIRGRCWFHRMQNFSHKVPKEVWPEIKLELIAIRDAKNYETGLKLAQEFKEEYSSTYPSLVKALNDDLEALLSHLKLPVNHRIYCRTTNLIERSKTLERRRTKVILFSHRKISFKVSILHFN
ncbi:MAG TPA: transposase [Candidatus Atribacteria bacterium]|nr:transposase [Candidatus Atribacteria bacterium]